MEEAGPGVHRFFELDIKMADGRPLERPHFLLNCRAKVDAVIAEKSKGRIKGVRDASVGTEVITLEERASAPDWRFAAPGDHRELYLHKEAVERRALCWDWRLRRLCISDAFHDHLMAAGVEGSNDDGRIQEI